MKDKNVQPKKENKNQIGEENEKKIKKDNKGAKTWVKVLIPIVIIGLAVLGYFTVFSGKKSANKEPAANKEAVAVVNGETISEMALESRLNQVKAQAQATSSLSKKQKEQVLQQMVEEELIYQKAKGEGVEAGKEQVSSQFEQIKGQFQASGGFEQALKKNNLTEEKLRSQIKRSIVVNNYLQQVKEDKGVEVTEKEIQDFYDKNVAGQKNAPALKQLKEQIKQQISQQKLSGIIDEMVKGLKEKADVEILF